MSSSVAVQEKEVESTVPPASVPVHDCKDFSVQAFDGEFVCCMCGKVDEEETEAFQAQNGNAYDDKVATKLDHNVTNGLLNTMGMQTSYASKSSPGLAFRLNNGNTKDAYGKRIKRQMLNDPYKSGLLADPSRGCHIEVDPLTHKGKVKFSRYDLPTLQLMKEKAFQRCMNLGLDVVEQSMIASELTRIYSNLVITEIVNYALLASLTKYKAFVPKSEQAKIESELVQVIENIRVKVISGCQKLK